jgi:precorrin-2 dehydrogenase / sirohydrochlorin ferrochelatase
MKLYPIFINMESKLAVIVGGGDVAYRKLNDILDCGAKIKIIAPEFNKEIKEIERANPGSIEIIQRKYKSGDTKGAYIVFAATNNPEVNKIVFQDAEKNQIPVNSADDPGNCSFFVPSMSRKGDLIIAVSTSGDSPVMAAKIRRILEKNIPENIEEVLIALHEARKILKDMKNLTQPERAAILKKITDDDDLLENLVQHNRENTILSFFNCILESIT